MWCALQALNAHCTWMRQRGTSASVPLCLRWLLSEAGVTQSTGWDRLNYLMLYHQHTTPKVNTPVSLYYENVFFLLYMTCWGRGPLPSPLHSYTLSQSDKVTAFRIVVGYICMTISSYYFTMLFPTIAKKPTTLLNGTLTSYEHTIT